MRGLRIVLSAGVLIKVIEPALRRQFHAPVNAECLCIHVRKTTVRRHPFQQAQSNLQQLLRRFGLQAFVFQVLRRRKSVSSDSAPGRRSDPKTIECVYATTYATDCGARRNRERTYLDLKFLVNLHDLAKDCDVLHEACEFPTVTDTLEQSRLFGRLLLGGRHNLRARALSRSHGGGTEASKGRGCSRMGW